jgi:hypothetical protein
MLVAMRVAIRALHDQKNPARVPLARPISHVAIIKASVMLHCFFKGLPKMGQPAVHTKLVRPLLADGKPGSPKSRRSAG